ncbi:MAG: hypothetical protein RLZZ488_1362 [Pseudomonadota bacterium]|jgi:hypothetical protein
MDQFPKGGQALLADAMIGLLSPLDSLRFMRRKKSVLVIGLAPYLIAIVLYGMLVGRVVTPMLIGFLLEKQLIPVGWATNLMLGAIIWIFALTIFALLGPSVINTLASPIFDRVASHTYEDFSGKKLPPESLVMFVKSFLGECSKLAIWLMVTIFLASMPFAAFIGGPLALWFLGWTQVDRTLNLQTMRLHDRLMFGVYHAPACVCLGLWGLVPGLNTLFTFLMASSGAVIVAKAEQQTNQ